ncbi:MAG: prolyl oligopeptidase family serine peptidase [Flavobacteriales bacterium]|nr:prolyl oligopeptidase family serine peptidase [Flavobacteriia bacterium]NCP05641.1 prolyl oligopeptidase family serine peptidase [Flavobacteriales bacterium]PIV93094.1 MAG: S9 family peptidase [Flavobacteriaceae bacterium CG17_big_fil_post_rev_8_21_14_2_50_33_15]PIY11899.1 MAG: S9 family peptidase [Flavobacteriaceae bacterium CG_4_10_14_3_um_filter_33_47]PJB18317.1 MAG: S9 family peptidase [Flavobacteriaceae bacterium CG_4_9_14_3_um_filter_33_16]
MCLLKTVFNVRLKQKSVFIFILFIFLYSQGFAQRGNLKWSNDGKSYYRIENNNILQYTLPNNTSKVLISKEQLTPTNSKTPLNVSYFTFSKDEQKVLIFTNTKRVWRLNTKGDYWVLDLSKGGLVQLGIGLPESSLMFAKFSPDGKKVAYVGGNNIYVEELSDSSIKKLTNDGSTTLINGTFDWAYEEEFACRDGFRWSPDSKSIAYWQIDASTIKKFYMINNTDAIYSQLVPLEYPKVGETPSSCKVGVVTVEDAKTTWMDIPGNPQQHYIVRMEYIPATEKLLIQQLNRKQNESKLFMVEPESGHSKVIYKETDEAWVDIYDEDFKYDIYFTNDFNWLNNGESILWATEKDGWRHLYQVSLQGRQEQLITKGNYDFIDLSYVDTKRGYVYFMASPHNATQSYLYKTKLNGSGTLLLLSLENLKGTHGYNVSPTGTYAMHTFSNHYTKPGSEFIWFLNQKPIKASESIEAKLASLQETPKVDFFKIKTVDGVEMDGWIVKPTNFDATKKYPVVFYVYSEPASTTVNDSYGVGRNRNYNGSMADDGYIYISLDNRGTPAPKGSKWRKSIYRNIGRINIQDQAMAAKEILKWDFVDPERVAVWGHSGGGSATLNLMFKYPEIYKTGISLAAVANQLTYDNIYQERYMGLPQENLEDFVNGSPVTHAKNLEGNLLYIHGTGDDNVHYQNAEILINELVKHNKQFQFMPYPNRTHGIREGEGTSEHLRTLYTNFLKTYCPPGGK